MKKKNNISLGFFSKIKNISITTVALAVFGIFCACLTPTDNIDVNNIGSNNSALYDMASIPSYSGSIYVEINGNAPNFTEEDFNIKEDYYSELENGRVGMAMIKTNYAKATADDEKNNYSSITPTGFVQAKYDTKIVPGGYIYHRCHVIAWKLGGIDVDKRNLMAGTQAFNVKGMKVFEDKVFNYLKENQNNHVLYRVTPKFEGDNLLATGVNIEAYSIEDNGKLQFNVFIYNIQEGITLNYANGESKLQEEK